MYKNDLDLSLNGETFESLKKDFDKILERTLGNMTMRGADDATITIKLGVSLDKMRIGDPLVYRDVVKPSFKHEISSVMTVKDKMTGQFAGDYELVFDEQEGKYVIRKYDDGQMSVFEGEYQEEDDIPVEARALPAPKQLSPYDWLKQFDGKNIIITETMGNYAARTDENEIVLSSATSPDNPFYCDKETLAKHVGHNLTCNVYVDGEDNEAEVTIYCDDCEESVFTITTPDRIPTPDREGEYEYSNPEE